MTCPCNCEPRPLIDVLTGPAMNEHTLARYGDNARQAVETRNEAICEAHGEGMSLRVIADAVGMSHMGVKRIIDRQGA